MVQKNTKSVNDLLSEKKVDNNSAEEKHENEESKLRDVQEEVSETSKDSVGSSFKTSVENKMQEIVKTGKSVPVSRANNGGTRSL